MWLTLRQLWKNWNIFIVALCLLIIPVLIFSPQENTRSQTASHNVQSNNKVENSANLPAAQNLPQSGPVSSQKSSASPATQATAPPTPQKNAQQHNSAAPPNKPSQPAPTEAVGPSTAQKVDQQPGPSAPSQSAATVDNQGASRLAQIAQTTEQTQKISEAIGGDAVRAGKSSGSVRRATPWNRRKICWARRWQDCSAARLVRKRATIIRLQ